MSETEEDRGVMRLHADDWTEIFLFLEFWDVRSLGLTCKTLLQVAEGNGAWEWMIERDFFGAPKRAAQTTLGWYPEGGFSKAAPRDMLRCYFKLARTIPSPRVVAHHKKKAPPRPPPSAKAAVVDSLAGSSDRDGRQSSGDDDDSNSTSNLSSDTLVRAGNFDKLLAHCTRNVASRPLGQYKAYLAMRAFAAALPLETIPASVKCDVITSYIDRRDTHQKGGESTEEATSSAKSNANRFVHQNRSVVPFVLRLQDMIDVEAKLDSVAALILAWQWASHRLNLRLELSGGLAMLAVAEYIVVGSPGLFLGQPFFLSELRLLLLRFAIVLQQWTLFVVNSLPFMPWFLKIQPTDLTAEETVGWLHAGAWEMVPFSSLTWSLSELNSGLVRCGVVVGITAALCFIALDGRRTRLRVREEAVRSGTLPEHYRLNRQVGRFVGPFIAYTAAVGVTTFVESVVVCSPVVSVSVLKTVGFAVQHLVAVAPVVPCLVCPRRTFSDWLFIGATTCATILVRAALNGAWSFVSLIALPFIPVEARLYAIGFALRVALMARRNEVETRSRWWVPFNGLCVTALRRPPEHSATGRSDYLALWQDHMGVVMGIAVEAVVLLATKGNFVAAAVAHATFRVLSLSFRRTGEQLADGERIF